MTLSLIVFGVAPGEGGFSAYNSLVKLHLEIYRLFVMHILSGKN